MDFVQSSNRVINSFPPLSNITPFTRVDGWSFLEVLEGLRYYIVNTLVEDIDENNKIISEQLNAWFERYILDFEEMKLDISNTKEQWQKFFDDFRADIVNQLAGLNDESMAQLVKEIDSATRVELDKVYPNRTEFNALETEVRAELESLDRKIGGYPTASIEYKTYGGINYNVVTLHTGGLENPDIFKSYLDIYQKGADFQVREHDIEIARDQVGASIIANSSGLVHISGVGHGEGNRVRMRGAIVYDGEAMQDFPEDGYWTGYEGYGMLKNGTLKGYSKVRGDSVDDMVNDGVLWSACFGPIIVEQSSKRVLSDTFWDAATAIKSSLNIVGQRPNKDIVLINSQGKSSVSGGNLDLSADIALREGCEFAISMDRGGSAQMFAGGVPIVASSDRDLNVLTDYNKRLVANYVYTTLPVSSTAISDNIELFYVSTLFRPYGESGKTPIATLDSSGNVRFEGVMELTPASEGGTLTEWPTTTATGIIRVPPMMRRKTNASGLVYGNGTLQGKWIFNANDGVVRLSYCDPGLIYVQLDSITWNINKAK